MMKRFRRRVRALYLVASHNGDWDTPVREVLYNVFSALVFAGAIAGWVLVLYGAQLIFHAK